MSQRLPHLKRYQRQLRDALLNPTLTTDQRDDIKGRLATLGQPRVYAKDTPSETLDALLLLSKERLLELAVERGLEPFKAKTTKQEIAQALLKA